MKKIYSTLVLAFMLIFSISVNAEDGYTPERNLYTNSDTNGAQTVIIYKGTSESDIIPENIYYLDQCNEAEGFSNLKMGLKMDASAGVYTVATDTGKTTFEISNAQAAISGAEKIEFLGAQKMGEASYSAAFGLKAETLLSNASALIMVMGDKAYKTDLMGENSIIRWENGYTYTEGENLMFAIQIDGIGSEYITETDGTLNTNFNLYVK